MKKLLNGMKKLLNGAKNMWSKLHWSLKNLAVGVAVFIGFIIAINLSFIIMPLLGCAIILGAIFLLGAGIRHIIGLIKKMIEHEKEKEVRDKAKKDSYGSWRYGSRD